MRVIWDPEARESRNQIARYIHQHFGEKSKDQFLLEVRDAVKMLKNYPSIGTIDLLFADRPLTYRSVIIGGLSKMVYFVKGDIIYIAAIWDCRREPKAQAEQVK